MEVIDHTSCDSMFVLLPFRVLLHSYFNTFFLLNLLTKKIINNF